MPRLLEDAPITTRAWTWWLLGSTVVACALVAAFNAVVDPTAQLGSGVLDPVAAGPRDRAAKVELLRREPPARLVVLGSSRSKKLDPARLGDWQRPVNAAVVGGDLFEARVLVAWLARRGGRFPQLVVGVDVEQFRDSSLQGSGFLDVPEVGDVARREASGSSGSVGDEVARLGQLLLTWQTTKASTAAIRARLRGGGSEPPPDREDGAFTETGIPRSDRAWFVATAASRFAARTPARVDASIAEYRGTYRATHVRLDPDAVADLRALLRIAAEAGGPAPLLYVTPAHPRFVKALADDGRSSRRARVLDLLRELEFDGSVDVLDCSGCIDDEEVSWIDGTHPSPIGTRQLATRLAAQLALTERAKAVKVDVVEQLPPRCPSGTATCRSNE